MATAIIIINWVIKLHHCKEQLHYYYNYCNTRFLQTYSRSTSRTLPRGERTKCKCDNDNNSDRPRLTRDNDVNRCIPFLAHNTDFLNASLVVDRKTGNKTSQPGSKPMLTASDGSTYEPPWRLWVENEGEPSWPVTGEKYYIWLTELALIVVLLFSELVI